MNYILYKKLISHSFQEMMIYRQTAFIAIVIGLVFYSIEIFAGYVYFDYADAIFGWTKNEYLMLINTANLITYIYQIFFVSSHENLTELILEGELDYVFVRPLNSQIFYSLYRLDVPSIINFIVVLCFQFFLSIEQNLSIDKIILYCFAISLAVIFTYVLNQIVVTISFWKDNLTGLIGIPESLIEFSSRPESIYPSSIRIILTKIIPILLAINLPVKILRGEKVLVSLLWLISVDIFGLYVTKVMWKQGCKKYISAN